ncbi:hypothetical protein [Roseovarius sp. PS-C2]|uniref:hypothetical protein n=1 Tax=Roseovarius sp. PS-C2 TaxID=2820814 RepID=UPI001C0BBC53|nr:hypothetical protein [Roseovarius sp. PS-C2]
MALLISVLTGWFGCRYRNPSGPTVADFSVMRGFLSVGRVWMVAGDLLASATDMICAASPRVKQGGLLNG